MIDLFNLKRYRLLQKKTRLRLFTCSVFLAKYPGSKLGSAAAKESATRGAAPECGSAAEPLRNAISLFSTFPKFVPSLS
jgi:hypothetical protein